MPSHKRISEERTRKELIDPQLERAGWLLRDHSKVKIEIPVDGYDQGTRAPGEDVRYVVDIRIEGLFTYRAEVSFDIYVIEMEGVLTKTPVRRTGDKEPVIRRFRRTAGVIDRPIDMKTVTFEFFRTSVEGSGLRVEGMDVSR